MATSGYTTIGGSTYQTGSSNNTNPPGAMITMTEAGTITKITGYVGNTLSTVNTSCTIYAGSAGARNSSVIARTGTSTVPVTAALTDFTMIGGFPVTPTTYWIQFNGDGGNGPGGNLSTIAFDTGGAANTSYTLSDVGSPTYGTDKYTLYATYTPAGGGTSFTIALV